jgi:hypothetical protein
MILLPLIKSLKYSAKNLSENNVTSTMLFAINFKAKYYFGPEALFVVFGFNHSPTVKCNKRVRDPATYEQIILCVFALP